MSSQNPSLKRMSDAIPRCDPGLRRRHCVGCGQYIFHRRRWRTVASGTQGHMNMLGAVVQARDAGNRRDITRDVRLPVGRSQCSHNCLNTAAGASFACSSGGVALSGVLFARSPAIRPRTTVTCRAGFIPRRWLIPRTQTTSPHPLLSTRRLLIPVLDLSTNE